ARLAAARDRRRRPRPPRRADRRAPRRPAGCGRASTRAHRGEGGTMSTRSIYEMAEAIAPGWERWRARIEDIVSPVRVWMLAELAPRPGDTVLELAAGAGDTGFETAAVVGERGRLISTDFSP